MKATKKRWFLAFLGALVLALAALFAVACNRETEPEKETATATLTYVEGIDGTAAPKEKQVAVGERLAAVLSEIVPEKIDGLEFGGWFIDGAKVADDAVMPVGGAEVYAKYLASYTVNVYKQDPEGNYVKEEPVLGSSFYGEAFTYDVQVPEHFQNGEKPQGADYADQKVSTKSLGINEVFTVYLARRTYTVGYFLNNGSSSAIAPDETLYGGAVRLKNAEEYSTGGGYRFDGWALTEDGNAVYAAGEELIPEGNVRLCAVWTEAVSDLFGGGDLLFRSTLADREDTVYLRREGIGEKSGVLNAITGAFSFTDENGAVLDGMLTDDGFYYYRDALNRTYAAFDQSGATLQIKSHGTAVYTSASGEETEGAYRIDFATGTFTFESADTEFVFVIVSDGQTVMFRTTGAEAGYYAATDDAGYVYDLFWFDGLGGLKYIAEEPIVIGGAEITVFDGYYELTDKNTRTYVVEICAPDGSVIAAATIRTTPCSAEFDGYQLSGTYVLGDDYAGTYTVKAASWFGEDAVYVLDGFGAGTKNGASGTYTVEQSESWLALINGSVYQVAEYWIAFTVDGETTPTLLRFKDGLYGTEAVEITGEFGIYEFENPLFSDGKFYNDGNTKAFLYLWGKTGNSDASLWIGMQYDGEWIYTQYDEGTIGFTYGGMAFNGIGLEAEFHFTFAFGDEGTVRYVGDEIVFLDGDGVSSERLVIDTEGKAMYTPAGGEATEVSFTVSDGVLYFYSFELPEGTRMFALQDENGVTATEILSENIYDIAYNAENRVNSYTGRMIMLSENAAVIGMLTQSGGYYYCYYGSVTKISGEDRYWFQMTVSSLPENLYEDVAAEYSDFDFKKETRDGKNVFIQYDKAVSIECEAGTLTVDGYGIAVYTPKGGSAITGTYEYYGNYIIVETETEQYMLRLTEDGEGNTAFTEVASVGDEVGYYYTLDEYGYIDSAYLFLDGSGTVLMYIGTAVYAGSYTPTGASAGAAKELRLSFPNQDGTHSEMYILYVQDLPIAENVSLNLFILSDETQKGSFRVEDNGVTAGTLYGNGYFEAEYTAADGKVYSGAMTIGNLTDGDYSAPRQFTASADGNVIVFTVTDDSGAQTQQFVFDLQNGVAVLRGVYGAYALEENGEYSGEYIYLDGHGGAVVYGKDGTVKDEGEYRAASALGAGVYQFAGETAFAFRPYFTGNDGVRYAYTVYKAENDGVYTADGWSLLKIDGFGSGVYINRYGDIVRGSYTFAAEGLLCLRAGSGNLYFELTENTFSLIEGDWIVKGGVLYLYTGSRPVSIAVPDGVKRIASGAFASVDTDYLTEIDLNEVEIIEDGAFAGCGLESVVSDRLLEIGAGAFRNCESLERVEIPSVTKIGAEAFYGCTYLKAVTLGGGIASVGANAFGKTVSSYVPATSFYVSEVDFAAASIDETAFNAIGRDGIINMYLYVSDIESMNAAEAASVPALWKNTLRILSVGNDGLSGNTYFAFASGSVYQFSDGLITVCAKSGNSYPVSATRYLYYFADAQDQITTYARTDGVWQTGDAITVSGNTISLSGEQLFYAGYTNYSFTVKGTQNVLSFYLDVSCYADYDDETLWDVTVKVRYPEYNGESVTASYGADGKIVLELSDGIYSAEIVSETACELTKTAQLLTVTNNVATPDYDNPRFTVTFLVAEDGGMTVYAMKSNAGYYDSSLTVKLVTQTAENTFTVTASPSYYDVTYQIVYTPAQDGQDAFVTVTQISE